MTANCAFALTPYAEELLAALEQLERPHTPPEAYQAEIYQVAEA